jgi:hypothetical protein
VESFVDSGAGELIVEGRRQRRVRRGVSGLCQVEWNDFSPNCEIGARSNKFLMMVAV